MKILTHALLCSPVVLFSCSSDPGSTAVDASTVDSNTSAGPLCDFQQSALNSNASVQKTSTAKWTGTATTRVLAANGIPDHDVGTFPNANNPNIITEQTVTATYAGAGCHRDRNDAWRPSRHRRVYAQRGKNGSRYRRFVQ